MSNRSPSARLADRPRVRAVRHVLDALAQTTAWGITEAATVVERTRIRSVDGEPVQHKLTVMPYEIATKVPAGYEGTPPATKVPDGYEGTPPMLTP